MLDLVQAIIDSMRYFSSIDYEYFINLSGHCYPIKSIPTIKRRLHSQETAFMWGYRLPRVGWGPMGGLDRIVFSCYRNPIFVFRDWVFNKVSGEHFESRRWLRLPKIQTRLPHGLQPYGGSAYFCLMKKHVNYILKYVKKNPEILSFFSRSWGPDELVFHTILLNSELKDTIVTNNNFRYISWSKPGEFRYSPAILTTDDAENLSRSSALFARKFDMSKDSKILDLIDKFRNNGLAVSAR